MSPDDGNVGIALPPVFHILHFMLQNPRSIDKMEDIQPQHKSLLLSPTQMLYLARKDSSPTNRQRRGRSTFLDKHERASALRNTKITQCVFNLYTIYSYNFRLPRASFPVTETHQCPDCSGFKQVQKSDRINSDR